MCSFFYVLFFLPCVHLYSGFTLVLSLVAFLVSHRRVSTRVYKSLIDTKINYKLFSTHLAPSHPWAKTFFLSHMTSLPLHFFDFLLYLPLVVLVILENYPCTLPFYPCTTLALPLHFLTLSLTFSTKCKRYNINYPCTSSVLQLRYVRIYSF